MLNYLYSLLFQRAISRDQKKGSVPKNQPRPKRRRSLISLEQLEDRTVPSTLGLGDQNNLLSSALLNSPNTSGTPATQTTADTQPDSGSMTTVQEIANAYQQLILQRPSR